MVHIPEYLSDRDKELWTLAPPRKSQVMNADVLVNVERKCERCDCMFTFQVKQGTDEGSFRRVCDDCRSNRKNRECRWCKTAFVKRPGNGALNKFCCEAHRDAYYAHQLESAEKAREKRQAERSRRCNRCAENFNPKHKNQIYCDDCAPIIRTGGRKIACQDCGGEFLSKASKVKRCPQCRAKAEQERRARVLSQRMGRVSSLEVCSSQKTGTTGELIFDVLCARNGWQAAKSIFDTQPGWDRVIVRSAGIFERVQVKSISSGAKPSSSWTIFRGDRPLTIAACDVVAVVDIDTADVWMLPTADAIRINELTGSVRSFNPSDWDDIRYSALGIP
jgi:hypothetical protein